MREPTITAIPCEHIGCANGATHIADDGRGATYTVCYHHAVERKCRWINEYRKYLQHFQEPQEQASAEGRTAR